MPVLKAVLLSFIWAVAHGQLKLEQSKISVTKQRGSSALIICKLSNGDFNSAYIHWYRQKPDQSMEHLLYINSVTTAARRKVGGKNKYEARKNSRTSTSNLNVNYLEKGDEGVYYCACWDGPQS